MRRMDNRFHGRIVGAVDIVTIPIRDRQQGMVMMVVVVVAVAVTVTVAVVVVVTRVMVTLMMMPTMEKTTEKQDSPRNQNEPIIGEHFFSNDPDWCPSFDPSTK